MSDSEKTEEKAAHTHTTTARADSKCSKEGCKRPYRAKGYCVTHYKLWRRGELEGHKARYNICSKEGCRKPVAAHGVCAEHGAPAAAAA